MAAAIHRAITLPADERRDRMDRMRRQVREHNIYGWAGLLLDELARIPRVTDRRVA
jgi:trehalose 6-phosphate synthase